MLNFSAMDLQLYKIFIFWDTVYICIANIIAPSLPNLNYTLHIGSAENTSKKSDDVAWLQLLRQPRCAQALSVDAITVHARSVQSVGGKRPYESMGTHDNDDQRHLAIYSIIHCCGQNSWTCVSFPLPYQNWGLNPYTYFTTMTIVRTCRYPYARLMKRFRL